MNINIKRKSVAAAILTSLTLSVCVASIPAKADPVTVNGGTVHFTGEVVNAACAVSSDSSDQTVALGQARSASLATAGAVSNQTPFNIVLTDCDTAISTTASVAFNGPANADGQSLAPSSITTQGVAAKNVGIQILDSTNTVIAPNSNLTGAPSALIDGTNTIPFTAQFISLGSATVGAADADATFNVTYN